jgi:ubiquinone/menaquinone biosynthesis C-methylase UbiE
MRIFQPDRHLLHAFVARHSPSFAGNVLDVGGGTRRYASLFTHCAYTVLDLDPETKPDIVASAEELPLKDASMDGVLCTQVLGDVWSVEKAVAECARVLKPGGLLLLTESLLNEEHNEPHDYWRFTRFAWQKLLAPSCDILVMEPRGGYFTQKAQQAIRYRIEKYDLYAKPLLGRIMHVWSSSIGKLAIMRDAKDQSPASAKFTLGYCILARKR